jgi:hypothetical protein
VVFDDQLRADVCGVYGGKNITTPSIDRLASQGVTLQQCPLRLSALHALSRHAADLRDCL